MRSRCEHSRWCRHLLVAEEGRRHGCLVREHASWKPPALPQAASPKLRPHPATRPAAQALLRKYVPLMVLAAVVIIYILSRIFL